MTKVLVISDSHGAAYGMLQAIAAEEPDACIFLGDGERDLDKAREKYPGLAFHAVRGNCDLMSSLPACVLCSFEGVRVFATHGHRFNVKYDPYLDGIKEAARQAEAQVALFGHTHDPLLSFDGELLIMNPGSLREGSYGVLELEGGKADGRLATI